MTVTKLPARMVEKGVGSGYELADAGLNRLFPRKWSSVLTAEEAESILACDSLPPSRTRGSFCPRSWPIDRFEAFVDRHKRVPEASGVGEGDRLLMLFDGQGNRAVGGLVFGFNVELDRAHAINRIWIDLSLAWILPARRGAGLGALLMAHLANYISAHPPTRPFVTPGPGVEVFIEADWTSRGGERLTELLANYFEAEIDDTSDGFDPPWPVASVEVWAGY
jgi:GNAT superfamily N-acetyltransferase